MNGIKEFRKFTRFLFHEHDLSKMDLKLSKPQISVLMLMDEHRGKPMSRISREIGLEKSSFTRAVGHLVRAGFIAKDPSAEDRRVTNIIFTEKGDEAVKRIKDDWNQYFESLMAVLKERERKEFTRAVQTVSRYMNMMMNEKSRLSSHGRKSDGSARLPEKKANL